MEHANFSRREWFSAINAFCHTFQLQIEALPSESNYRDLASLHDAHLRPTLEELKQGRKTTLPVSLTFFIIISIRAC